MDNAPVRKAADVISRIIQPQNSEQAREWTQFYAAWSEIAGEFFSAHSKPVDVKNGTVLIEVDHPGWIQRMQFNQATLLKSIQRRFPSLKIRSIGFRIAGDTSLPRSGVMGQAIASASPSSGQTETVDSEAAGPEGADPAENLETVLERIPDEGFRQIMASLADTLKKRK